LPESNKLFDDLPAADREKWYVRDISEAKTSVTVAEEKELAHKRFAPKVGVKKTELGLPIIPLVDNLAKPIDIGAKDLPAPSSIDFYGLQKLVRKRAEKVVKTLVDRDLYNETSSMMLGGPVRYVASIYGTEIISQNAMQKIKDAAGDVKRCFWTIGLLSADRSQGSGTPVGQRPAWSCSHVIWRASP
jgi:hypothetical protein